MTTRLEWHQASGEITWPVIGASPEIEAFVLPLHEGSHVPADDADWIEHLERESPLNTTEGLSMPWIAVQGEDFTVTCIFENPFHNALVFAGEAGRLTARVTHSFSASDEEAAVTVILGDGDPLTPARNFRQWLIGRGEFVPMREKIARTPRAERLLGAAHIYLWGDGYSLAMLEAFQAAGLDRLWLGLSGWAPALASPEIAARADELGLLMAPYDSYHSMHPPDMSPERTWPTAQFDQHLWETGGVMRADGTHSRGFRGIGRHVNSAAVRPYVERRVSAIMAVVPFSSWFVDCDAFGELFDDFNPLHPATMREDMEARLDRLAWIRDTFGLVIGSEGGSSYAAPVIHFAHGMTTPVIGWGDPRLTERDSEYCLGGYHPPGGPRVFLQQVRLAPGYEKFHFDPRFRLPLYQAVFHDSVITTHQWGFGSLKFSDAAVTNALLEALYQVPPLYHLNRREWARLRDQIVSRYEFWSPLHRGTASLALTQFQWLTEDRLVQRTLFGDQVEVIANFSESPWASGEVEIPARSVWARRCDTQDTALLTPGL